MTSNKQIVANRRNAKKSTGPRTKCGKAITRRNGVRHGLRSQLEVLPDVERQEDWEVHLSATVAYVRPQGYLEEVLAERIAFQLWRLDRIRRYERAVSADALETAEDDVGRTSRRGIGPLPKARQRIEWVQEQDDLIRDLDNLVDDQSINGALAIDMLSSTVETARSMDMYSAGAAFPGCSEDQDPQGVDWTVGRFRKGLVEIAEAMSITLDELRNLFLASHEIMLLWNCSTVRDLERKLAHYRGRKALPNADDMERVVRCEKHVQGALYKDLHELQRLQAARRGPAPAPIALDVTLDGEGG